MFITPHILFTELDGRRATQVVKENLTFTDNLDAALKERWKLVPDLPENEKILISKSTDGWHSTGRNTTIVDVIKTVPQNYPIHKIFPLNLLEKTDPDFTPMGYGRIHIPGILFNTIIKPDTEHAFYREFEITDAAEVKELQLFVASDNACITYINDQLVDFDPHMRTESGHDFEYWNRDIRITNNQLLKNGKNRILVMLKNEKNSNEAFFDCELRAHLKNGNGKLSTKAAQSISPKLGITQKMNPEQTKMTSDERIKELAKKWLK
jgi:hypothetical protein